VDGVRRLNFSANALGIDSATLDGVALAHTVEGDVLGFEKARAMGFDKPLAWNGTYPTLGIRRAIHYSKGALVMAQPRATLGDAGFWSGLRHYTRDHAGGTVTSMDLERAMEASSGRDLRPLFAKWVFGDGLSDRQR
jgi:hypothetical protein